MKRKAVFVTGTDTEIGKTAVTFALATLLQNKGIDVGIMKPVQCSGNDAAFLKESLHIQDSLKDINPFFAPEPLSPHIAFKRAGMTVSIDRIVRTFAKLKERHEFLIVEGAGGLLVPIRKNYLMSDLTRDLDLEVIIVSRLGLGTLNHTLLTINQARYAGIPVVGIIFNSVCSEKSSISEKTNPDSIRHIGDVPILGNMPYLKAITKKEVIKRCSSRIDAEALLKKKDTPADGLLSGWDKKYLWHPFTQMQDWLDEDPLVIKRGKGCYLQDTKGRWYLDGVSSLWVNLHGHRHNIIDKALKAQINQISHSTLLGLSNEPAIRLAKQLVNIVPKGLKKVFYSDNGSTAVEVAIKIAYQYWQNKGNRRKIKIVHLEDSYHGDTLGSVSVGGIELFHKVYRNIVFKTIKVHAPYCYRCPVGKIYPKCGFACLRQLRDVLRTSHDTIVAFVVEPIVQGAAGMIVWPRGILKRMKELCEKYNVLFIADEVATGFGRTGKMFACNHEGVVPDILCLAKGITAGYLPLAATLTTQEVFDGFLFDYKEKKTFFHGHTYTGNPVCCTAAIANLDVFEKENTLKYLVPKIKLLNKRLKKFYNLAHVGDIRQKGLMVGIELVRNKETGEPYRWDEKAGVKVCQKVRDSGLILRPLGNVIVIMPPLAISLSDLNRMLDVTYHTIESVTKEL